MGVASLLLLFLPGARYRPEPFYILPAGRRNNLGTSDTSDDCIQKGEENREGRDREKMFYYLATSSITASPRNSNLSLLSSLTDEGGRG